jgi:hypothetical protein
MNQKFLPLGGVNLSTSLGLIPPTDYTASFNCHISNDSEGKAGAITNIMGNVPTSIPYLETEAQNPYYDYYKQPDIINGGYHTPSVTEYNGTSIASKGWDKFFFETHKGRVLGVYEEPERRRLYYYIGWDGFTFKNTVDGLEGSLRKNSGILALVCFEQYETIDDYYILQQNGSIIITDDGDFLVNEEAEDGDLLGQTYIVGLWGFGDETYTWGDTFNLTGIGKIGNEMYWAMGDKFDPMTIDAERGILTYQSSYVSEYNSNNTAYDLVSRSTFDDTYYIDSVDTNCDQDRYDAYFNPNEFTFIRRGGIRPPSVVPSYDSSKPRIIGGNVLQFAYRYVYKNGYRSVLSPFSSKIKSTNIDESDYYNVVTIYFPNNEEIPKDVDRVELCVRRGTFDSTDSNWSVIEIISRSDMVESASGNFSEFTTDYTGERVGEIIDAGSASLLFDAVPYRAEALETAKNRAFMGNVIPAGSFDVAADDFTLQFSLNDVINATITGSYVYYNTLIVGAAVGGAGSYNVQNFYAVVNNAGNPANNGLYPVPSGFTAADFNAKTLPDTLFVHPSEALISWSGSTKTDPQIRALVEDYYQDIETNQINATTTVISTQTSPQQTPTMVNLGSTSSGVQYKGGGSYQLGIIPFDSKGRTCGVITDPEWIVDVPERTYSDARTKTSVKATFVNAPDWVSHFAFARTKCLNISSFLQYKGSTTTSVKYARTKRIDDVTSYELINTGALSTVPTAEFIAVSLKGIIEEGGGFEINQESTYRVLVKDATNEIEVSPIAMHVEGAGELWLICTLADYDCPSILADQPIIEIRELVPLLEKPLFYETKAFGKTGNSGQIFNLLGDVTLLSDQSGNINEYQNPNRERKNFLDLSVGRTYIAAPDQKQKRIGDRVYYSGISTPDSERTFINNVSALDYKETSDNGGEIKKLVMSSTTDVYGQVMLAIAETNTTSIYLGETLVRDKEGEMLTTGSPDVIGGMSEVRGMFGTSHPMSVAAYQGTVCWYDVNKGAVVQYGSNGIRVISDLGMSNYFRTMADFVRPLNLAASINKRYNQYYITIGADSDRPVRDLAGYATAEGTVDNPFEYADGFVLVFDMDTDRWMTALTMDPEALSGIGVLPAQFNEGRLWLQKSASRNKFFGSNYPSKIAVVLNAPPEAVKVPEAISVESDEVPTHVYIQNLRPYQQQTDIDSTEFVEKEGIYYAPILRDRLTGNPTEDEDYFNNLIFGDRIRGQFVQVALIMDYPDDDFEVNAINVKYAISSGHTVGKSQA